MPKPMKVDIAIIGAGSGGLSVAAGAAQLAPGGARRAPQDGRGLPQFRVRALQGLDRRGGGGADRTLRGPVRRQWAEPEIDFLKVNAHVHGVIGAIAPHDSVARFRGLGVDVIEAEAEVRRARTISAGGREITARRFVIATGSRAFVPPIPGLKDVPPLTNETSSI